MGVENKIIKNSLSLNIYGNNEIKAIGYVILHCMIKEKVCKIKFIVVDCDSMSILGLNTCSQLELVKHIDLLNNKKTTVLK